MRFNSLFHRVISLFLIFVLCGCLCPAAFAAERDTVKVGFFSFDGYHMIDENNNRSGYGYDFLRMAARYWNVDFEYVGYENSWSDMADMLKRGEIDLVTSARATEERMKEFDFSKPIGTSSAMLTVKNENNDVIANDYSTYNGLRIGLLQGNSRNDDLEVFARDNGFSYTAVYYEKEAELVKALKDGKVDALLTSTLRNKTEYERVLDTFATKNFYVMVRKGDTELLNHINYAIDQLNATEGDWFNTLNNKYYNHYDIKNLNFTLDERELIEQYANGEKKLVVSACLDKEPYAYEENGEAKGILFDYFAQLAEHAGIPYEILVTESRDEYIRCCEDGQIDVCLDGRFLSESQAELLKRTTSAPYTTMSLAMVTRRDFNGTVNTLAVSGSQGLFGIEDNLAVGAERIEVDSRKEGMQAVLDGEADATVVYLYTAQQFVNQDKRGILTYTMLENPTFDYHLSFSDNVSHELAGIFTKCIYSMP